MLLRREPWEQSGGNHCCYWLAGAGGGGSITRPSQGNTSNDGDGIKCKYDSAVQCSAVQGRAGGAVLCSERRRGMDVSL